MAEEIFEIRPAVRHAVPQIAALYGPTFSGKTFGALLLASGLIEPGGKIGFLDTENGRGCAFADDPEIQAVIPQGYETIELSAPFHPLRYVGAIRAFEASGCQLVIVDSASHAWDGEGGCHDITAANKNKWNKAKLANKKFLTAILHSGMHVLVCLRAQEKTKLVKNGREEEIVPLGMLPICERNFPYDLGLSFSIDADTHLAKVVKWPKGMNWLFNDWKPQLLTPQIGQRIREWNNSAPTLEPADRIKKRARVEAELGLESYSLFFQGLTPVQKKLLVDTTHAANKAIAIRADADRAAMEAGEKDQLPDPFSLNPGSVIEHGGKKFTNVETPEGVSWVEAA